MVKSAPNRIVELFPAQFSRLSNKDQTVIFDPSDDGKRLIAIDPGPVIVLTVAILLPALR
jgi:hypothetical protein